MPEAIWTVTIDDEVVRVTDASGESGSIARADLAAVIVETNDSGPWGSDVWWLLYRPDGALGVGWPQGATGESAALDQLTALPGFDHEAMLLAMTSTDNAVFVLWERQDDGAQ